MSLFNAHSDEQLLQYIQKGDEQAFDALYRRYWVSLFDSACKRLDNKQQAEDIVQEVFTRLWIRRKELQIDNVAAYLHTAVRYNVISYLTRDKTTLAFYEPFEWMFTETDTPEVQFRIKELYALVYAYAETLSERKKQILLLYIKNKLSTKEIAEELGISQKSVQNQLGTTLSALRKSFSSVILILIASGL